MSDSEKCPVCGSSSAELLFSATDSLVSGKKFPVKRCLGCGFVFTSGAPPEDEASSWYLSEDYISHTDSKRSVTDIAYHLARKVMLRSKYRLIRKATGLKEGRLLDIGSGTGYFAAYMQKKGWKVTALEISEKAREYSLAKFGITVSGPSAVKEIPAGSLDCVTLWHVLEHLYNPGMWLDEARRILSGGGKCIVALPNFDSADSKWFGDRWAALDVPRHLWHFTPATFSEMAARHGFRIIRTKAMPLDVFYISVLSFRNQGQNASFIKGIALAKYLSFASLFRKSRSSSVIYVLRAGNN